MKDSQKLAIFGSSGHAFDIQSTFLKMYPNGKVAFIKSDQENYYVEKYSNSGYGFIIGIGDNSIRAKVRDKIIKIIPNLKFVNCIHPKSILGKYATTGDGLLVALEAVKALNEKIKASDFFNVFKKTPQILKNIKCKKENILNDPKVKSVIKLSKKIVKGNGRILVRKSGTEPVIRVMGESDDINLLKITLKTITKKLI